MPPCPKPKKISRSKQEKKLDVLFSQWIRKRDGRCLRCGRIENLQCSHIASRKHMDGRWNENNAITLCYACHLHWWHKEPILASKWLQETYPEYYDASLKIKNIINKNIDLDDLMRKYGTGRV